MSDRVEPAEAAEANEPSEPQEAAVADAASGSPPVPAAAWPWRALARPAVIATAVGVVEAASVAATDIVIAAAHRALTRWLGRPVTIEPMAETSASGNVKGFGVVIRSKDPNLEAMIVLDRQVIRTLATTLSLDAQGMAGPSAPGPVAEPGAVERGLIEYLTLIVFDGVLKEMHPTTKPPKIAAFCDEGQASVWLRKHKCPSFDLKLSMLGETGAISIHVDGWRDEQWAAMRAGLAMLGRAPLEPTTMDVRLALPAVSLQPEEFEALEAGDVILLGGPSLSQLPQMCELVTDTHWSLGPAKVTHDTPTYFSATWKPGDMSGPGVRLATMQSTAEAPVIQMLVGRAKVAVEQLAAVDEGLDLNLEKEAAGPVDIMLGVTRIARGEFVVVGSELGVRVLPEDHVRASESETHEIDEANDDADGQEESQ